MNSAVDMSRLNFCDELQCSIISDNIPCSSLGFHDLCNRLLYVCVFWFEPQRCDARRCVAVVTNQRRHSLLKYAQREFSRFSRFSTKKRKSTAHFLFSARVAVSVRSEARSKGNEAMRAEAFSPHFSGHGNLSLRNPHLARLRCTWRSAVLKYTKMYAEQALQEYAL